MARNITIDGCSTVCARKSLELIGVNPKPYILTALGLEKHETPVTKKVIDEIFEKIINSEGFPAAKISTVT
ncbi:MAG TPA: putative zinc-binding protein, partial [Paludibacter sp.]|nr:putative zinc-binding protein [Paludibacter sp.]